MLPESLPTGRSLAGSMRLPVMTSPGYVNAHDLAHHQVVIGFAHLLDANEAGLHGDGRFTDPGTLYKIACSRSQPVQSNSLRPEAGSLRRD